LFLNGRFHSGTLLLYENGNGSRPGRSTAGRWSPIIRVGSYGGWGIKRRNKNDKCYTVSGKLGLRLKLVNGKTILIGTQRKEALIHAMAKLTGQSEK